MNFQTRGLSDGDVLVCIPGLMGGPEDFSKMVTTLEKNSTMIIIDPIAERRTDVGMNLSLEIMNEISYDSISLYLKELLSQKFPDRNYYFLGISIGGKIVFDFATNFPDIFSGGVVTDVGPGSFSDSDLFLTIESIVDNVNLNLTFPEMKLHLQEKIPDKNLRILIQTQISYPNKVPPAVWKVGIRNFEKLLKRQSFENQEASFPSTDAKLSQLGRFIHVLHSDTISGIGPAMTETLKSSKSIKFHELTNTSHFLHISHPELITGIVLSMIGK